MRDNTYLLKMERKLVDNFQMEFYEKMGYFPYVITKSKDEYKDIRPLITLEDLEKRMARYIPHILGQPLKLKVKIRKKEIVELRQFFTVIARKMGYTYKSISDYLGYADHTTAIHSFYTFRDLYETSEDYRSRFDMINFNISIDPNIEYDASTMDLPYQTQGESEPPVLS
jgi:hypothetical protein